MRFILFLSSVALAASFLAGCGGDKCEEAADLICNCEQEAAKLACTASEVADALPGTEVNCEGDTLKAAECAIDNETDYCKTFETAATGTAAADNAYLSCVGT